MRGSIVWPVIFCVAAFVALIAAAFIYASSESQAARTAEEKAAEAIVKAISVEKKLDDLRSEMAASDAAFKKFVEIINEKDLAHDKMKQKVEWLELKASRPVHSHGDQTVTLKQEKPLQINVLYRESKGAVKPTDPHELPPKLRQDIVNKVKKQVQELSK